MPRLVGSEMCIRDRSESTAGQSTLVSDGDSSGRYKKFNENFLINNGLKILKKNIVFEENYWKINASHDAYKKKYGHTKLTHPSNLFYPYKFYRFHFAYCRLPHNPLCLCHKHLFFGYLR